MMQRPPSEDSRGPACKVSGDQLASSYDLVEPMQYLYVHVVKAKDLTGKDVSGSYVEIRLGNFKGNTRHFKKSSNLEWNQVFAFSKDRFQASVLEVTVKDKDLVKNDFMGRVLFKLTEVPTRVPPDHPLAPKWYRLEDQKADKVKGEIMLAVWMGTQADKVFPEAWHSDEAGVSRTDDLANIQSKVYLLPKLWYLRVNVIEAQDLQPTDKSRYPKVYVKAMLGNQVLRTQISQSQSIHPLWNEDLMFVAAEPFEEPLLLSVENRIAPNKDELLGRCQIPLQYVDRRLDNKPVNTRWYNLEKHAVVEGDQKNKETNFVSWIHLWICLEGGYHVQDESMHYSSDLRPSATQLWKQSIGVLELGILNARGLLPMKTKDGHRRTDAYCVAKYGQKWVRTRTIINSFTPSWNEQYVWEVFDLCTVLTIGVFDNFHLLRGQKSLPGRDSKIGKVRIWLSSLEKDRVYSHSYPLLVLHPNGVKKMGEIHLAVRFTCSSLLNTMHMYSQPLLPKMHYICPLTMRQLELRHQASQIVSMCLGQAEPPLTKEVVEYMLDIGSHMWSMRRSKANFFRMLEALSGIVPVWKWFDEVCNWKNPITTVLIHVLLIILVRYPEPILPLILLFLFLNGVWSYRSRPREPLHMDTRLSLADSSHPDELDEEFDTFPTSRPHDIVRMRYDRLRSITGRIQWVVGNLAEQGDKLQSLLSWRDPWATGLFTIFCLVAAIVLCLTPYKVVVLLVGLYLLRHPIFRQKHPSVPLNFFRRLPAKTHCMI